MIFLSLLIAQKHLELKKKNLELKFNWFCKYEEQSSQTTGL